MLFYPKFFFKTPVHCLPAYSRPPQKYQGQFFRDHRHGFGKYTYADGSVFVGTFYMDRKEGYGLFTYAGLEAEKFAGLYHQDEREGPGVLSYRDGRADVGLWHRERLNRLLTSTPDGQGFSIRHFPDVEYFPDEHRVFLNPEEAAAKDPLLDLFGDIAFPPDPLDYDPLATATVREQLSSALCRDTDVNSAGFDRENVDERFEDDLERQSATSARPVSSKSGKSGKSASTPRGTPSKSRLPSSRADARSRASTSSEETEVPPPDPVEARNASASCIQQQLHILRFQPWQSAAPLNVEAVLHDDREAFPDPGPLEEDSLRLMAASRTGDVKTARVILDQGHVDPDVMDVHGRCPLLEAAVSLTVGGFRGARVFNH